MHSVTQVERRETTNVTFAHSLERVIDDVKMLMLMLLLLVILAGGSHSWEPETSSVARTSSEYAFPQSPLLLSFLVMVAVTAAAAVWASHRHLSRTAVQYASHSQSPQRQHMLFECPFCFLLCCVCASFPFTCDGRARGALVLAHTPRRALLPVCPSERAHHPLAIAAHRPLL